MQDISIYRTLKDPTRQNIIRFIGSREQASYSDILVHMNISTGKLNYHLKLLSPFLEKQNNGYALNDHGKNLFDLLSASQEINLQSSVNLFRALGWLFFFISLSSIYLLVLSGSTWIQFAVIVSMLFSAFLFYYSGNTKFNFAQFIVILIVCFFLGVASLSINYVQVPYIISFPYIILAIILFSTFMVWAMSSRVRVLIVTGILLGFSLLSLYAGYQSQYISPIPVVFLAVTLVAKFANGDVSAERISTFLKGV